MTLDGSNLCELMGVVRWNMGLTCMSWRVTLDTGLTCMSW